MAVPRSRHEYESARSKRDRGKKIPAGDAEELISVAQQISEAVEKR